MAGPFTETYTIGLPTATQEEIDGLIADLRSAVQKWGAAADRLAITATTLGKFGQTADAITTAIPLVQASVQEIADAAKAIKPHWPL